MMLCLGYIHSVQRCLYEQAICSHLRRHFTHRRCKLAWSLASLDSGVHALAATNFGTGRCRFGVVVDEVVRIPLAAADSNTLAGVASSPAMCFTSSTNSAAKTVSWLSDHSGT